MTGPIGFVGLRTDRRDQTVALFEALGFPVAEAKPGQTGIDLGGCWLEVYDREEPHHSFFDTGPVVGFRVPDFDSAEATLAQRGCDFLTEPQHEDGSSWRHFRLPDGTVAEIIGPGHPR